MDRKLFRWIIWISLLSGLLLAVGLFSLCIGSSGIPLEKIISLPLTGRHTTEYSIIFDIRLPRILLAFAVGGALSIAGVIFQGIFRNPLVEPYTLGVSGGAALGVCLSIVFGLNRIFGFNLFPLVGFLGALLAIFLVYLITSRQGTLKITNLLLTGVMISFICSSLIMLIMAISRTEDLYGIIFWIMGSLEQPDWMLIKIAFLVTILGMFISLFFAQDLNAFSLGEEEALHLGINVERTKKLLFVFASLLTGASVSVSGIIGFVGLVVPHFARMLVGQDHWILLVVSSLCGGIFLILCDTLARTVIAPLELPVGVITGIVGGTLFVYFLTKRQLILGAKGA